MEVVPPRANPARTLQPAPTPIPLFSGEHGMNHPVLEFLAWFVLLSFFVWGFTR